MWSVQVLNLQLFAHWEEITLTNGTNVYHYDFYQSNRYHQLSTARKWKKIFLEALAKQIKLGCCTRIIRSEPEENILFGKKFYIFSAGFSSSVFKNLSIWYPGAIHYLTFTCTIFINEQLLDLMQFFCSYFLNVTYLSGLYRWGLF